MTLLVDNRSDWDLTVEFEDMLNRVALKCLEYEGFSTDCEISLSIVSGEEIREINCHYRSMDKETDVLSFPLLTFEEGEKPALNENGEIMLGDIIISIGQATEQAMEYGHSIEREMAFLTAHSMLHLLGYDHMEQEEEQVMFAKQKEILELLGITR